MKFQLSCSFHFNSETTIKYQLPEACEAAIKIYNIKGKLLQIIIDQKQSAGYHLVNWNGRDGSGKYISSGVYFYCLQMNEFVQTKKMMVLR